MALADIRIEPMTVLVNGSDIGCTDGNMEFSFSEDFYEVKCHQNFGEVLDMIRIKNNIELSIVIQETTTAKVKQFLDYMGEAYTPSGGTEVAGVGSSKLGSGVLADCVKLTFKPVGSTDDLRNLTFWKAYPSEPKLTYSGEEVVKMEVAFKILPDLTKVAEANKFVYGDQDQDFDLP